MIEVKIYCACGAKFKFDVEPVDGHMPAPVGCPMCGRDATARANTILRLSLSPEPASQKNVTINIQNTAQPAPITGSVFADQQPVMARPAMRIQPGPAAYAAPVSPAAAAGGGQPRGGLWKIRPAFAILSLLAVAGVVYCFIWAMKSPGTDSGYKPANPGNSPAESRSSQPADSGSRSGREPAVSPANSPKTADQLAAGRSTEWNFKANNQVIIYVQHASAEDVANACAASLQEYLSHKFKVAAQNTTREDGLQFTVKPEHNGYVQIIGGLNWREGQFEATARNLSDKFQTVVFVEKDARSRKEYLFEAFEQGVKTFLISADAATNPNDPPALTSDQEEWAMLHGYKPGAKGFAEFGLAEANELTKKCGLQLWDEPPGTSNNRYIVLADADSIAQN